MYSRLSCLTAAFITLNPNTCAGSTVTFSDGPVPVSMINHRVALVLGRRERHRILDPCTDRTARLCRSGDV
ncbi:MAG: hypothetical protein MZV63_60330 [Marinilabiliales bacterium]|nr:hypothetical protein [Marinilabiliales bacterium]